jgi:hypothetical protein
MELGLNSDHFPNLELSQSTGNIQTSDDCIRCETASNGRDGNTAVEDSTISQDENQHIWIRKYSGTLEESECDCKSRLQRIVAKQRESYSNSATIDIC